MFKKIFYTKNTHFYERIKQKEITCAQKSRKAGIGNIVPARNDKILLIEAITTLIPVSFINRPISFFCTFSVILR